MFAPIKMRVAIAFLVSYIAVSVVVCKPTEIISNLDDNGALQQLKSLAQIIDEIENENQILKEKLETVQAEQLKLETEGTNYALERASDTGEKEVQGIHDIAFTFPRYGNTADWIKYMLPFPRIEDLTMCFWITPEDLHSAFIVSYAISTSDYRQLSINIVDETTLGIFVDQIAYNFEGFTFKTSEKKHLCITLSLYYNQLRVFENGAFKERKDMTHTAYIIGGGALYFGQDQTGPNSGFRYSYQGEISNIIIWPRELSVMEIRGVANSCSHPKDFILRPQLTNIEWSGNVKVSIDNECHTTAVGAPSDDADDAPETVET